MSKRVLTAVRLAFGKVKTQLVEHGHESVEDFAGYSIDQFTEYCADLNIEIPAAGSSFDTPQNRAKAQGSLPPKGEGEPEMTTYMGIDVERRVYGEGRNRTVYQNARAFEGAAYVNIYLPMPDGSKIKVGAVNLQDFSENSPQDNGTKRGRALILGLLKMHGKDALGKLNFDMELNVSALQEDNTEEFENMLAGFFETAE